MHRKPFFEYFGVVFFRSKKEKIIGLGLLKIVFQIVNRNSGYFYRLGLKMGIDGIVAMVDEFDLNKRTGIDLPNEVISWTPSREFKRLGFLSTVTIP